MCKSNDTFFFFEHTSSALSPFSPVSPFWPWRRYEKAKGEGIFNFTIHSTELKLAWWNMVHCTLKSCVVFLTMTFKWGAPLHTIGPGNPIWPGGPETPFSPVGPSKPYRMRKECEIAIKMNRKLKLGGHP